MFWADKGLANSGHTANPTTNMMNMRGLNVVPNARMDAPGTIRLQAATIDPYLHTSLLVQPTKRVAVNLRQSAEISGLDDPAKRLYPGMDLKLLLMEEGPVRPALALGFQSMTGHARMAGEYLSLSKRYNDFDFTGGIAWGRLGSAGHIQNPLRAVHSHFGRARDLNSEMPNGPEDWFTGPDVGFFAGFAWRSPVEGLSLKADWGADRYIVEASQSDYKAPKPWSIGFDYSPRTWIKAGAALIGGQKIMGSLSLHMPIKNWPGRGAEDTDTKPLRPYRTGIPEPAAMVRDTGNEGLILHSAFADGVHAGAQLALIPGPSAPYQLGRAARHMANHAGRDVEALTLTPHIYGLSGAPVTIMRAPLERAAAHKQGSAAELWHATRFNDPPKTQSILSPLTHGRFLKREFLTFTLDQTFSLAEEDQGVLYRTSLIANTREMITRHFVGGFSARFNLFDNLRRLNEYRPKALLPVRSNEDDFARNAVSVERAYIGYMRTLKTDLHIAVAGGYLEEMYAGVGGEILYRPFGKRFAIGAEAWQAFKRDPHHRLNLGLNGDHILSGHIQAWYEIPDTNLTLKLRAGRYLAEDVGGTLSLTNHFENGTRIEAFVTATNRADFDLFGGTTHLYSGLRMRMPIGNAPIMPRGSEINVAAMPMGRDTGQAIHSPLPLYELSDPISYRHLAQDWPDILR